MSGSRHLLLQASGLAPSFRPAGHCMLHVLLFAILLSTAFLTVPFVLGGGSLAFSAASTRSGTVLRPVTLDSTGTVAGYHTAFALRDKRGAGVLGELVGIRRFVIQPPPLFAAAVLMSKHHIEKSLATPPRYKKQNTVMQQDKDSDTVFQDPSEQPPAAKGPPVMRPKPPPTPEMLSQSQVPPLPQNFVDIESQFSSFRKP